MSNKKLKNIVSEEKKQISNCDFSKIKTDGRLISINEKYLAIAQNSPGVINIIDSNDLNNLSKNNMISTNDKSNILDMEFSPFDSNILAYSTENKSVIISKIDEKDKKITLSSFDTFQRHQKKVNMVSFNPVASNIMSSGTLYGEVYIWDSTNLKEIYRELPKTSQNLTSLLWAPDGKSIGISTKKGVLNIFDIRENKYYIQNQIEGFSDSTTDKIYFNWIDSNNIVALGHNKKKERIMCLFDIRKQVQNRKIKGYSSIKIDNAKADCIPFVNHELKLIYAVGKDTSKINICDYSSSNLEKLTHQINVQESNVYSVMYPRKFLDKKKHEIDRIVRSNKDSNNIYYVTIKIPEKNSGFDGDLYPKNESGRPLYTEKIWKEIIEGKIKDKIINNDKEDNDDKVKVKDEEKKEQKFLNMIIKQQKKRFQLIVI